MVVDVFFLYKWFLTNNSYHLKFVIDCNEALLDGTSGILRPQEGFVNANTRRNGFTVFRLPSNQNSFTLTSQSSLVTITQFRLRVREVCTDGSALSVFVDYISSGQLVSLIKRPMTKEHFNSILLFLKLFVSMSDGSSLLCGTLIFI